VGDNVDLASVWSEFFAQTVLGQERAVDFPDGVDVSLEFLIEQHPIGRQDAKFFLKSFLNKPDPLTAAHYEDPYHKSLEQHLGCRQGFLIAVVKVEVEVHVVEGQVNLAFPHMGDP